MSEGRDRSIVALRRAGEDLESIASRFGVSRRTVFRALARERAQSAQATR
jgi:transposase